MALPPLPPLPPLSTPPGVEKTIVRNSQYEVSARPRNGWLIVFLRGNYADDMLEALRKDVFSQKVSYAIDTSALSGITVTLARELWFTANRIRTGDTRLVLLNPPERMRSLMGLIAPGAKLPTFTDPEDLPNDPKTVERHLQLVEEAMGQLRQNLGTNPLWRFIDRESCWLCPFCGEIQNDIKIVTRVSIPHAAVEAVYKHVNRKCRGYSPVAPRFKPAHELEEKIRTLNEEKFAASKRNVAKLEGQVKELGAKAQWAESIEAGLKIAVDRQRRLLPAKPPEIAGFEIAIVYRPAARVSGDFYDFVDMGAGRIGFTIGDVAGHGIEAGILMGMTKKVLNIRASELQDPVKAMLTTNGDIYKELDRQTFVTAFLGMLDPATRTFSYARAGHNPPLLFNKSREPSRQKLEAGGLMLGMSTGVIFERSMKGQTVQLQSGDLILLYTDGAEEAKNLDGELYGTKRMMDLLEAECARPANFILGALGFELDRFIGGQPAEDDITAVLIRAV